MNIARGFVRVVLLVAPLAACAANSEPPVEDTSVALSQDTVALPLRSRFYIHSNIFGHRTMGFDVETSRLRALDPSFDAEVGRAFVLVPRDEVSGAVSWVRYPVTHLDTAPHEVGTVERYRGGGGAEIVTPSQPATRALGVAFGVESNGRVLWLQPFGLNTPIEEGGEGIALDGSL